MSRKKKTNIRFSNNSFKEDKKPDLLIARDIAYILALFMFFLFNIVILLKLSSLDKKIDKIENKTVTESATKEAAKANVENVYEKETKPVTEPVTVPEEEKPTEAVVRPGEGKYVYLTFDDGPSRNTRVVLDILDKYNIKATFFCVFTEDNDDLYREIVNRGHSIAIHSMSHDYDIIYNDIDSFIDDVMGMREFIYNVTGVYTDLYRFPGGSSATIGNLNRGECIRFLNEQGIHYFDWNVASGDAVSGYISPDDIINNVYSTLGIYDNSVILMHDSLYKTSTMVALDELIERILADGYTFKAIDMETETVQQLLSTNY